MLCSRCYQTLPKKGSFVECSGCANGLHFECSSISVKTYTSMSETKREAWRCVDCKGIKAEKTPPKGEVTDSSDATSFTNHFAVIKREIEKTQKFVSNTYDEMVIKVNSYEETFVKMNKIIESLITKEEKNDVVDNLSARFNHLEQLCRERNIELTHVQQMKHEDLESIVMKVATFLNISLESNDIETVFRLPAKLEKPEKPQKIIVKFFSCKKSAEFITKRKSTTIVNSDVILNGDDTKIYVNENLTLFHGTLFWKAKTRAAERHYDYVWFRYGKIRVRKSENCHSFKIITESDLDKMV